MVIGDITNKKLYNVMIWLFKQVCLFTSGQRCFVLLFLPYFSLMNELILVSKKKKNKQTNKSMSFIYISIHAFIYQHYFYQSRITSFYLKLFKKFVAVVVGWVDMVNKLDQLQGP